MTDRAGVKITLSMAQMGTGWAYIGLTLALDWQANLGIVIYQFFSLFMNVMQTAEAALSYLTKQDERAKAVGRLSGSYSLGMITGSFLGGYLSENYDYGTCVTAASSISMLCTFLNMFAFRDHKYNRLLETVDEFSNSPTG